MDMLLMFVCVLLALVMVLCIWGVSSFNRLRTLEARCQQAQSDIDVQLKQRSDLLPNLVATIKGFVGQETHLLDMLKETQSEMNSAASIHNKTKANANISNSFSNIFASLERIPELQSSGHYIALRTQILDIENKIAASRRFLNLATSEFNMTRMQFPASVFAAREKIGERKGFDLGQDRLFHEDAPVIKL